MMEGIHSALSGLRAYSRSARVTANNLANVNTTGFKATRLVNASAGNPGGVNTVATQTIHSQAGAVYTGEPLDMAISGKGFFKVKTAGGDIGYTRAGSFGVDNKGRLADTNGNTLQPEIQIPAGAGAVTIERNGQVTAQINGAATTLGQVELADFNNPSGLAQAGGGVFLETGASGQPISGASKSGGLGEIIPSSLETSNVDTGRQMVDLIQAENGFKAQTKVIRTADEMFGAILDIKA